MYITCLYICTYMYITLYNANMFAPAILLMCLPTTLRLLSYFSGVFLLIFNDIVPLAKESWNWELLL